MTGSKSVDHEASDVDRLDALEYLVEALIIGQWARSSNPIARARADVNNAAAPLDGSNSTLSTGAAAEVARILTEALSRLNQSVARSGEAH